MVPTTGKIIGPIAAMSSGLWIEASSTITDWQGVAAVVIGVGGIVTGLGSIIATIMQNKTAFELLKRDFATSVEDLKRTRRVLKKVTALSQRQQKELNTHNSGITELKLAQKEQANVNAAVEVVLNSKADERRTDC